MSRRGHIFNAVTVLATLATVFFGLRSYGSFLLLRSANEIGRPQVSSLRAWMTLDHVAATYRVPESELITRLGLPPDTKHDESLKTLADRRGVSRFDFVRQVQRAVGEIAPISETEKYEGGILGSFADRTLSAVLVYGYPALAATLLLGAAGLPLPTGVVAVLAGSLAALGHIQWFWAGLIAVVASIAGDALAYLIGRTISENFLARHGRLFGYSPERFRRFQALFNRWGGLTVLFSRTLVSHLSSLMSLFAGLSRYAWPSFLLFSGLGRVAWTAAYLGLGFIIGSNIDAASSLPI